MARRSARTNNIKSLEFIRKTYLRVTCSGIYSIRILFPVVVQFSGARVWNEWDYLMMLFTELTIGTFGYESRSFFRYWRGRSPLYTGDDPHLPPDKAPRKRLQSSQEA